MNIRIVAACLAVLLNANTIFAAIYTPGGPVYVNPEQEIQATPSQQTINYVTQTVYGFLDFTTTIGNTVMLFSPQSSSSAVAPTSVVEEVKPTKVEEKKPVVVTKEIKASQVEEKKPIVTIKEIKASPPSSIVNVVASIEKPDRPSIVSVVNVVQPVSVVTSSKTQIISTKVDVIVHKETVTPSIPTEAPVEEVSPQIEEKPFDGLTIESSIVEINSNVNSDIPVQIPNNIGEPEYDFLSRQPAEYVEETYRVHNLRGGKPQLKQRPTEAPRRDSLHPTGLVTKLGGTVVKDGVTTIHETSVIGTYISGKYAQVLQSSSQIFHNPNKAKIAPSPSLKILKTAAPAIAKDRRYSVEATPSLDSYEDTLTTAPGRKRPVAIPPTSPADFKSRFRNRKFTPESNQDYTDDVTPAAEKITTKKFRSNQKYNRPSSEVNTVSVFPETSSVPAFRRNKASRHDFKTTSTVTQNDSYSRRGFKPRPHPTNVDAEQQTTSLYKFKLNRTPGRWQYKTTPKPRVNIRKSTDEPKETATETSNPEGRTEDGDLDGQPSLTGDILEDDGRNGIEKPLPVETLKVEISTPSDFADIYYEIATIKSPYTFQVGPMKKTRFITVTSTFEKTLEPETSTTELTGPLTENILATTSHLDSEHNLLDSTIATLPPLYLTDIGETPSLETLTETFSTSHVLLKTHILPIVYNENSTDSHTLIQTYHVTRLVTATKTLPPMESYHFVPSKTFNEFNSRLDEAGSELHLELEFGDNNEEDEDDEGLRQELPAELDLSKVGTDLDLLGLDRVPVAAPPKAKHPKVTKTPVLEATTPKASESIQPEIQQLLRLLNPAAANLPQVITSSKPVIKLETVYDSHVIPIFNGVSTIFSTLTRPIGTVTKTDYEYETTTIQPSLPIPPVPMNPLFPPQQQFQVTSAPIVQNTVVTLTDSKVLKLTFGAKTAYTTLFSTHVTPTLVTTFVTTSVPVAPVNGAAFPGYFPAPYAPFPYVG